jgi:hypothetical protein
MSDGNIWTDAWDEGEDWSGGGSRSKRLPRGEQLGATVYELGPSNLPVRPYRGARLPQRRRRDVPLSHGFDAPRSRGGGVPRARPDHRTGARPAPRRASDSGSCTTFDATADLARLATEAEAGQAAEILARAFVRDPVLMAFVGEGQTARMARYFELECSIAFAGYGEVWLVARAALERLLDLAGLEAARADVRPHRLPGDQYADALEVRLEAPLRRDHRVAPVVTEARLLATDCADLRHRRPRIADDGSSYCALAWRRTCENRSAISSAARAASAPLSTRASACSVVSTVRTPNATGTPVSRPASCSPDDASPAT